MIKVNKPGAKVYLLDKLIGNLNHVNFQKFVLPTNIDTKQIRIEYESNSPEIMILERIYNRKLFNPQFSDYKYTSFSDNAVDDIDRLNKYIESGMVSYTEEIILEIDFVRRLQNNFDKLKDLTDKYFIKSKKSL